MSGLELAARLMDSVDEAEPDHEVQRLWQQEVEHRMDDFKAGRAQLLTEEEALNFMRSDPKPQV
jgi:putative addiction module component (TIGR02574 family)